MINLFFGIALSPFVYDISNMREVNLFLSVNPKIKIVLMSSFSVLFQRILSALCFHSVLYVAELIRILIFKSGFMSRSMAFLLFEPVIISPFNEFWTIFNGF